jgi:hypothetical protein
MLIYLFSVHPETPDDTGTAFDQETSNFCKVKEIKELSGGVALCGAQSNPLIDAEIAEKAVSGRKRTNGTCSKAITEEETKSYKSIQVTHTRQR